MLHQPVAHVARLADVGARQAGLGQFAHQKVHTHLLRFGHLEEVCQLAARYFDHANNARRDLGYTHAARVTGGEKDLDGLGAWHFSVPSQRFLIFLAKLQNGGIRVAYDAIRSLALQEYPEAAFHSPESIFQFALMALFAESH